MGRVRGGQTPIPFERKALQTRLGKQIADDSRIHRGMRSRGQIDSVDPVPAVVLGEVPAMPAALKANRPGRRYWKLYWKEAAGWLGTADYPVVLRLCVLHDLAWQVHHTIEDEGLIRQGERGTGVTNLLNEYLKIIQQIERLENVLGFNPVERSRIRVESKSQETSLDAWRKARNSG